MKHIYLFIILTAFVLFTSSCFAQEAGKPAVDSQRIEGLSVYPNPVLHNTSTIFITSKKDALKKVSIYNVLGKQISRTVATRKELNIAALNSGVYILKITEGNVSETRKLVIK